MHSSLLRVLVTSLRVLVTSHAASASVHETRSSNAVYSTKFASECDVTSVLYCIYIIYYIKLKSRLSVRLSDRPDDNSVVPAWIDAGLARRDSYVFGYLKVHF